MEIAFLSETDVAPLLDAMRADDLDVIPGEGTWLGALDGTGRPLGVVRVFHLDGHAVLDDVWVAPDHRTQGHATALIAAAAELARPLWLICDEPDVPFYAARGFTAVDAAAFPAALADHYAKKSEWPAAPDHAHVAMRMG